MIKINYTYKRLDSYRDEQEADAKADEVMRMSSNKNEATFFNPAYNTTLQRKCAGGKEEEKLQRKSDFELRADIEEPSIVHEVINSGGQPLDAGIRDFFEPRFGNDFSDVRIHSDLSAAKSAQSINALAYTTGNNIVFNQNQFAPGTDAGKNLLAHELTHVVQQKNQMKIQRTPIRVTINSNCSDPRPVAEAIPGAVAMVNMAQSWFISFNPANRARINQLLRTLFLSDSESVRDHVFDKILSMKIYLQNAQSGNIFFDCSPSTDPECDGRNGYVRSTERNIIHICPAFIGLTLEEKKWNLVHETAHLSGVIIAAESYHADFGTVDCTTAVSTSVSDALNTADNYAKFIWCLTRPAATVLNNP